jgi:predicted GNAT family acetyltransferase
MMSQSEQSEAPAVRDNAERSRYEMTEDGRLAWADYYRNGDVVILPHVEADPALRGTGAAGRLMEGVLSQVRAEGLKVRPVCSYAVAYIRRNKQHHDLLA